MMPDDYVVSGNLVALKEEGSSLGCEPLKNNYDGKVLLIDRGECLFTIKVRNAEKAGAVGVLIRCDDNNPFNPGWDGNSALPTIISGMVSKSDGTNLMNKYKGKLVKFGLQSGTPYPTSPTVPSTYPTTYPPTVTQCETILKKKQCRKKNYCIWKGGRQGFCMGKQTKPPTTFVPTTSGPNPPSDNICDEITRETPNIRKRRKKCKKEKKCRFDTATKTCMVKGRLLGSDDNESSKDEPENNIM